MKRVVTRAVLGLLIAAAILPFVGQGTAGALVGPPALLQPPNTNPVTEVQTNPTFEWAGVPGATAYQLQISRNPQFNPIEFQVKTVNVRYTPLYDMGQTTFYWRVAAFDANNAIGPYPSAFEFVKVPPDAPTGLSPASGTAFTFPAQPPTFSWSPYVGAASYHIQISTVDTFSSILVETDVATNAYSEDDLLPTAQTFFWRVAANSKTGLRSQYSETRTFSIAFPATPTLLEPPNTDPLTVVEEVNFKWTAVAGAATYDLQYSTSIDFNTAPVMVTGIVGLAYSPPITLNNTSYFWHVRARTAQNGTGSWSPVSTFTRAWPPSSIIPTGGPVQPNDAITLLTPADHDYNLTTPVFSWTPQRLASKYQLQIATNPEFNGAISTCTTTHTTISPSSQCAPSLNKGTQYFWRVRGIDDPAAIVGLWSPVFDFIHVDPMVAPTAGGTTERPVLSWPAVPNIGKYRVTIFTKNDAVHEVKDTVNTTYVPQNLTVANSPYKFYVQTIDLYGKLGLIPASTISFTYTGPNPPGGPFTPAAGPAHVIFPLLTWPSQAPTLIPPTTQTVTYAVDTSPPGSPAWAQLVTGLTTPGYAHITDAMNPGTYDFRIRAFQGNTLIATSNTAQFTISPFVITTLVSPPNNALTPVLDTPTFTWQPIPNAMSYKIEMAKDINFTNGLPANAATVRYPTFTPLNSYPDVQAGEATYWWVIPCSQSRCGPSASSFQGTPDQNKIFSFRKQSVPVKILAPADDTANPPANPIENMTFMWEDYLKTNLAQTPVGSPVPKQEARWYRLTMSTRTDFATIIDQPTVDGTQYTPFNVAYPDGPIFWRIEALDGSGNSLTPSPPTYRTVHKKSPAVAGLTPGIVAPAGPYPTVVSAPTLSWNPLPYNTPLPLDTPPNVPQRQSSAAYYQVEIYKNPTAPLTAANRVLVQSTFNAALTPRALLASGDYGWRVRRYDIGGNPGPWSSEDNLGLRRFTIVGGTALPTFPLDQGVVADGSRLWFRWNGTANAASYRIDVSTLASNYAPVYETQTTVANAWNPTFKYADGVYRWRVIALDSAGNPLAPVSSATEFTFTVGVPGSRFHPMSPTRVLDSRTGTGWLGKLVTGADRNLIVTGGGVPTSATAVIMNVTVTESSAPSFLTVYPNGDTLPNASNLNFSAGQTIPNLVTVKVGTSGGVRFATAVGGTHVIADIVGYYDDGTGPGDRYVARTPQRFLDSRGPVGNWNDTQLGPNSSRALTIKGVNGIPSTATSVVMNVTVTGGTAPSFLTVFPKPASGSTPPNASNLNFDAGQTIPNLVVVQIGAAPGDVMFYNKAGSVDIIADVVGFYDSTTGDLFHALSPSRILDSRSNNGLNGTWGPGLGRPDNRSLQVNTRGGVPSYATAVVMNTTVTDATAGSFLTLYPTGEVLPTASNLNFGPGQTIPNLVMVKTGTSGRVDIKNLNGNVNVIGDVVGYFASF